LGSNAIETEVLNIGIPDYLGIRGFRQKEGNSLHYIMTDYTYEDPTKEVSVPETPRCQLHGLTLIRDHEGNMLCTACGLELAEDVTVQIIERDAVSDLRESENRYWACINAEKAKYPTGWSCKKKKKVD